MYQYGQSVAVDRLQQAGTHITGINAESAAGIMLASALSLPVLSMAAIIFRERLPTSQEQRRAMTVINWGVFAGAIQLWLYATVVTILRLAADTRSGPSQALCHSDALLRIIAVLFRIVTSFVILIELTFKINYSYAGIKRRHCREYIVCVSATSIFVVLGSLAMYRTSGTVVNGRCVIGFTRDFMLPVLASLMIMGIYGAGRICRPLLRINDAHMKAWGTRVAIGILTANLAVFVSFVVLTVAGNFVYNIYADYVTFAGMTAVCVCEAYLIDYRPSYKEIVDYARSSLQTRADEAQLYNEPKSEQQLCSILQQPRVSQASVNMVEDIQSSKATGPRSKCISILDSKSLAEFMFDDSNMAAPVLPDSQAVSTRRASSATMFADAPSAVGQAIDNEPIVKTLSIREEESPMRQLMTDSATDGSSAEPATPTRPTRAALSVHSSPAQRAEFLSAPVLRGQIRPLRPPSVTFGELSFPSTR